MAEKKIEEYRNRSGPVAGIWDDETPTLDLHGYKHEDVEVVVDEFVIQYAGGPAKIITGNSIRMKELVQRVLNRHSVNKVLKMGGNLGMMFIPDLGMITERNASAHNNISSWNKIKDRKRDILNKEASLKKKGREYYRKKYNK